MGWHSLVAARRIGARPLDRGRQFALIGGALGWLALVDLALAPARPDTAALVVLVLAVLVVHRRRAGPPALTIALPRRPRAPAPGRRR